jgi:predicted deacylase
MLDPSILVGPTTSDVAFGATAIDPASRESIQRAEAAESLARQLAAVVDIQAQLDDADEVSHAALTAARAIQQRLSISRVVVAWRDGPSDGCRVVADTREDTASVDPRDDRIVQAAAEESASRGGVTRWPPEANKNRHAMMAIGEFAQSVSAAGVVAVPLRDTGGVNRGAVLAVGTDTPLCDEVVHFLDAIAGPLASKMASIGRSQPGRLERLLRGVTETVSSPRRWQWLSVAAVVFAILLMPLRYRIGARCELHPVERRYVAAPFDGPLQTSMVRPGDMVSEGDLLAKINPREIDFELAGLRADLSRAQQEQKGLMASHDVAGSKIAELEVESLRLKTDLLQYRRFNLDILSPISGLVVSGDIKQSEGTPLSRGETLFEIAPLGKIVVEIAVPESDYSHVRVGMPVHFQVHALPQRRFVASLDRMHPRAELVDHENVFIAEVTIDDPENVLRPGMLGRATIIGDRHPLGWNLLHKAYYALRSTMGW